MLYATAPTKAVMSALDNLGFEELLALPAIPANNPRRMRYPVTVRTSVDGARWCLRSFGTGFDLVDPIRSAAVGRWYSVGWGLHDGREVAELLLLQAVLPHSEMEGVLDRVNAALSSVRACSSVGLGRHGRELRVCATLDRMPEGRC
ncbi:hypothetical protein [Kutzneria chonburiensis]|uniref:Uncharacterized protein n=1 Tax=Kutzneria chonburiensis TaxID=1483604 RepID=A0ABV6MQJ2_9PSEU|nr:hypothetical protein [Kutzneria chonburiensis]